MKLVKISVSLLTLLLALNSHAQLKPGPPDSQNPPRPPQYDPGQGYGQGDLNQFYRYENDAIYFQRQYNQASSGSYAETQARQNRDKAIQYGLSTLQSGALSRMQYGQIEQFSIEMNNKYNQASSGSALENFYRQARTIALNEFDQAIMEYVNYVRNSNELESSGMNFRYKYNQAASGSALESSYRRAYQAAFNRLPSLVYEQNRQARDFRELERIMLDYQSKYNQASNGSVEEQAFRTIQNNTSNQALQLFQNQISYMNRYELQNIADIYNQKYNQASSGSAYENFCRQVRDMARSRL